MAGTISNENELIKVMKEAVRKALDGVTKDVLQIFREEYIMKMVYEEHIPNSRYYNNSRTPTYEFKDAWDWSAIREDVKELSTQLWYDGSTLSFDEIGDDWRNDTYLHGSRYSTPPDVRMHLMDILNKKGRSSSLWLSSTAVRKRAYWTEFIKDMITRGELEKIVTKHFVANGFIK